MKTVEQIESKQDSAESLHQIAGAMKNLSLSRHREFRDAVNAMESYRENVELGFRALLHGEPRRRFTVDRPDPNPVRIAIVFGSSQGMCGTYNEQLARFVADQLETADTLIAAGDHAHFTLEAEGLESDEIVGVPRGADDITDQVRALLTSLEDYRSDDAETAVRIFHHAPKSATTFEPRDRSVLPLDPEWLADLAEREWEGRSLPTVRMPYDDLLAHLIEEHLFVALFQAFAMAQAAEHSSRMVAMQSAEQRIEGRLDELEKEYNRVRQHQLTQELIEVMGGYEASRE